jgi:hypothetical protein
LQIPLNVYQVSRLFTAGDKVAFIERAQQQRHFGRGVLPLIGLGLLPLSGIALAQNLDDPARAQTVAWTAQASVAAKGLATVTLHGSVAAGWHVYSLKQLPEGPTPLVVSVAANDVAAASGAAVGSAPTRLRDPAFGLETQFYAGDFTLALPVRFKPHAAAGQLVIPVDVRFQTCNGRVCQPPKTVRLSAAIDLAGK